MSHTPGPWYSHREPHSFVRPFLISNSSEGCTAQFVGTIYAQPGEGTADANAKLIAAAPELLAACRRAKDLLVPELVKEPDRTIFWELVSAIRKAEGKL